MRRHTKDTKQRVEKALVCIEKAKNPLRCKGFCFGAGGGTLNPVEASIRFAGTTSCTNQEVVGFSAAT